MDKPQVKRKDKNIDKLSWETAVEDAERMIREAQQSIRGLRQSLRVFKARRDAKAPWPSESATPR
jgi:hypothetical protein